MLQQITKTHLKRTIIATVFTWLMNIYQPWIMKGSTQIWLVCVSSTGLSLAVASFAVLWNCSPLLNGSSWLQLLYAAGELQGTIFLDSAVAVLHFFLSLLEAGEEAVLFFLVQFCPNHRLLLHLRVLDHPHNFLKIDNLATATSTHFSGQQSMLSRTESWNVNKNAQFRC